jgi:hypothetical protein
VLTTGPGMQICLLYSVYPHPSSVLCGPGGDLLSRVLRQSTIGAEAFDGRVRDGIGSYRLAEGHQAGKEQFRRRMTEDRMRRVFLRIPSSVIRRLKEAKLVFSILDRIV